MISVIKVDRSTRLLMVTCALLAAIVVAQLIFPAAVPDNRAPGTSADDLTFGVLPSYTPQSFDHFSEILERPLFFQDRRLPPEPVAAATPTAAPEPLRLNLEGVAITSDSRVALLRDQRNNALIQVAEGMPHNGWTLEDVESGAVIFRRGEQTSRLELEIQANRPGRN